MAHQAFTERGRRLAEKLVKDIDYAGGKARIGTTYRDYGQNWTWETILVESKDGEYQALNPRQFDYINKNGELPSSDVTNIIHQATK